MKRLPWVLIGVGLLSVIAGARAAWSADWEIQSVARIRNCSSSQEKSIRSLELRVSTRINELVGTLGQFDLRYVHDHFIVPKGRRYVEGSIENQNYETYLGKLRGVFAKMQNESRAGINFECKDSAREPQCQGGEVIAYVLYWNGTQVIKNINLCSGFFATDADRASETMLHELSHYAADTDDLAGSWLDTKNPKILLAPDDAYHIEQFMLGDVEFTLRGQIWFWNWAVQ